MIRFIAGLFLALLAAIPAAAQDKTIAFSFDDVPRHAGAFFTPDERAIRLIAGLAEGGVAQAGFFVTPSNLDTPDGAGGAERIRAYVAAGHVIANHSAREYPSDAEGIKDLLAAQIAGKVLERLRATSGISLNRV